MTAVIRRTELRETLLVLVSRGEVFNRIESGCTWRSRYGRRFPRGYGRGLTTLNQKGLINLTGEAQLRIASLTKLGRTVLFTWKELKYPMTGVTEVEDHRRCSKTIRHDRACEDIDLSAKAYSENDWGLWNTLLRGIKGGVCCTQTGEPRECGWEGLVDVEVVWDSPSTAKNQLWTCPRCAWQHVEDVT